MRYMLFLFLPALCQAQTTNSAVSDSMHTALSALEYDTAIQPLECFYDANGNLYTYIAQVAGEQFKAISHTEGPNVFKFSDETLHRSWHIFEMYTWLLGSTGSNFEGYEFSGSPPSVSCTLTISGDTWIGEGANNTDALGMAFYHFLIDPDFLTYLE